MLGLMWVFLTILLLGQSAVAAVLPSDDISNRPGTATGPRIEQDVLGIYFDQTGSTTSFQTTAPGEIVWAYLLIINPSYGYGVSGWECCVETAGGGDPVWFTLNGNAINVDTPPCFAVGISGSLLPGSEQVLLATMGFIQSDPSVSTQIYLHPALNPSVPDVPVYIGGFSPGFLLTLDWSSGGEALPVAVVNDPGSPVFTPDRTTRLLPNVPNPFNPRTTIRFELAESEHVRLEVYDLAGRRVKTLLDEWLSAGLYARQWSAKGENGESVPSGLYVCRLTAGELVETQRLTLIK
ncbi:MAG: T9SS type A sorting domain-containing protein [bacterium]